MKKILFILFASTSLFASDLATTDFAEKYTILTVKQPASRETWLVGWDLPYSPMVFTNGTIVNDNLFDKYFIPKKGDKLQLVRAGGWFDGPPYLGYYTTRWKGGTYDGVNNRCWFVQMSKEPNYVIAKVQKIRYGNKIYPMISLKDGSTWILAETNDSEKTEWKVGKSVLVFRNYSPEHQEHPYLLIQPFVQFNLSNPDDTFSLIAEWYVNNDSAVMGWVELITIPDREYTLENW